jgi:hypothetical protein
MVLGAYHVYVEDFDAKAKHVLVVNTLKLDVGELHTFLPSDSTPGVEGATEKLVGIP